MTFLTSLYGEIQPKLYSFFYMKTGSKELAEDLTQEVFYQALKTYGSFKNNCSLKTWIFSIANNLLKKHYRNKKYFKALENKLIIESPIAESLEDAIIEKNNRFQLMAAINKLDELTREIVLLRIYGELSFKEIGDTLSKTENYARVTFHRGKLKIQKEMEVHNEY
ncbi:RNA polymerase sigma factor [Clostridium culturomicium]|uniref:RNA polymerase sigma factor n=1 Tax=Clostridium culturomicium TaxID=1499683 RepID=UPI00058E9455|nr:RNA polymerase sigma factor [Clostridium culturomicium]